MLATQKDSDRKRKVMVQTGQSGALNHGPTCAMRVMHGNIAYGSTMDLNEPQNVRTTKDKKNRQLVYV